MSALPDHATTLRAFRPVGVTYEFWLVGHNSQGDGPESNRVTHLAT